MVRCIQPSDYSVADEAFLTNGADVGLLPALDDEEGKPAESIGEDEEENVQTVNDGDVDVFDWDDEDDDEFDEYEENYDDAFDDDDDFD